MIQRLVWLIPNGLADLECSGGTDRYQPRFFRGRRDVPVDALGSRQPKMVVAGWLYHSRILSDGRRQILALTLPGEIISGDILDGLMVTALTDVTLIDVPLEPDVGDLFVRLAAASDRLHQAYLHDQIVRLGRQSAYERVAHLLLELHGRLTLTGLARGSSFDLPLTQELIADLLGITSVHVNRTLQQLRRDGLVEIGRGRVQLRDREALVRLADFTLPAEQRRLVPIPPMPAVVEQTESIRNNKMQ